VSHSRALADRLVRQAVETCRAIDNGRMIERRHVKRHGATLAGIAVAALLLVALGPAYLRHGLSALLVVSRSAEAASPYRIEVTPGTASVPRGSDQQVKATLVGFAAPDAEVRMRAGANAPFERVPLVPSADPRVFEGFLFHLEKSIDYYV